MEKNHFIKNHGITLVALVITIIVLIILASVSMNIVLGEGGILSLAKKAKQDTEQARIDEEKGLNELASAAQNLGAPSDGKFNETKKVNTPRLEGTGLTPVKIESDGSIVNVNEPYTEDWYSYTTTDKRWANAKSADGSLWVWIPRFAYKITTSTTSDNSNAGTIDIKFLKDTTDEPADNSEKTEIKRATSGDENKTTENYYVHPAFTDESKINYANGGWNAEIPGFWIAKFEAGYEEKGKQKESNYVYTTTTGNTGTATNANYYYGSRSSATKISYPVFKASRPSYNNISIGDSYTISKHLTDAGNPYGLKKVDSHLIKNSEWGAVAYLSWSSYGTNKTEMFVNNVSANGAETIYAVTGYAGNSSSVGEDKTRNLAILLSGNSQGNWTTTTQGQKASTTGNITGVYDMSGGLWERTAGFVSNGHNNLLTYGKSLLEEAGVTINTNTVTAGTGKSTKYVTIYEKANEDNGSSTNLDTASQKNFAQNKKIGDAIKETTGTKAGTNESNWYTNAWNADYSYFPGFHPPFTLRGGRWGDGTHSGVFAFGRTHGGSDYGNGFRAVLVPVSSLL